MADLLKIEGTTDVAETLQKVLDEKGSLQAVIVVGLYKDGSPMLRTSTISGYQKAFLTLFLNAWMVKWFKLEEHNG